MRWRISLADSVKNRETLAQAGNKILEQIAEPNNFHIRKKLLHEAIPHGIFLYQAADVWIDANNNEYILSIKTQSEVISEIIEEVFFNIQGYVWISYSSE